MQTKPKKNKSIKSYNLTNEVIWFINTNAERLSISKWEYIFYLIKKYISLEEENKNLKYYLESSQDIDYIREQIIESEIDFQTESKYTNYAN